MISMNSAKPIVVKGRAIAEGRVPAICVPLVGATSEAVLAELDAVLREAPDVVEWRVDHFAEIGDTQRVIDVARTIKARAGSTPLLFTCRSATEGGQAIARTRDEVIDLYERIAASRSVDLVDYEVGNGPARFARVRNAARGHDVTVVGSFHDFSETPGASVLVEKFAQAKREGADVAKVATMPHAPSDVLALLTATVQAHRALDMPLISMSMGALGVVSRVAGFVFGSSLTFAAAGSASAPGQMPIGDVREVLDVLRRAASR